jgi:BCD family chlorophyll transporter-like MFS transporter
MTARVPAGTPGLGWLGIARLGLVQACLGAIVVLTTSTLNRVMVVELALPALLPGLLVGLHYALQVLRPRMGYGSDVGGRRTPWIVGGMGVLALGGSTASVATAWMAAQPSVVSWPGIALAALGFLLIGLGVSACGTALLTLLAKQVAPERRAPAATLVWIMMIMGFAITAGSAGALLDPFSPSRLVAVTSGVCALAFVVTALAITGVEHVGAKPAADTDAPRASFMEALREVWAEPTARRFTVFVFVSMLAYSSQDLILEPFAGTAFGFTPGESTKLAGVQHSGVLAGMLLVAAVGGWQARRAKASALSQGLVHSPQQAANLAAQALLPWIVWGCLASAVALLGLVAAGLVGPGWPLKPTVWFMGAANGAFSIAAIGSMMSFAGGDANDPAQGTQAPREGTRMGLWGASQAIAFGIGGLAGSAASDVSRWVLGNNGQAYAVVFAAEAALFVLAAVLMLRVGTRTAAPSTPRPSPTPHHHTPPAEAAAQGAPNGPSHAHA